MKTAQGNGFTVTFDPERHKYEIDGKPVPSVTQILGVLDKPGLPWWGMRVGVEGVKTLALRNGPLTTISLPVDTLVSQLTEHKLTVNHQRDKAGARGTSVHKIAEQFAKTGKAPDPDTLPESERGYVEAFFKFVAEREPEFVRTEVIVGHPLGFAGTFDAHAMIDGELWLLDYKSSKGVYPESMHPQLEAYDEAAVEMGLPEADQRVIVHLQPSGEYALSYSVATFIDFLTYFNAFTAHKEIKQRAAQAKKDAKKQALMDQAA